MPRAQQSKEGAVLGWFKTAPLAVAVLILNLAKDSVRERQAVKAPVVAPKPAKPTPKPVARKAAKPKPAKPTKPTPRKRVRPSRAKGAQAAAAPASEAQIENLGRLAES